jgi:hypothetical protein
VLDASFVTHDTVAEVAVTFVTEMLLRIGGTVSGGVVLTGVVKLASALDAVFPAASALLTR